MFKPQNRWDFKSRNQKTLQQHHILECLATLRGADCLAKLVNNVLGSSEQDKSGHEGCYVKDKDQR